MKEPPLSKEKDNTILIPKAEKDVLILGDMNDSTHTRQEFKYIFDYADAAGFKHSPDAIDPAPMLAERAAAQRLPCISRTFLKHLPIEGASDCSHRDLYG